MSLRIKPTPTLPEAHPYLLLFPMVLLGGPIPAVAYLLVGEKVPKLALRDLEQTTLKGQGG